MKMFACKSAQDEVTHQRLRVGLKKSFQQGRSHFYARSVCVIREHGKLARTPLAAFFNRPIIDRSRVTKDWHGRGFSCGIWTDHAGREWKDVAQETDELFMVMAGKLELELERKPFHPSVGQGIHIRDGMTYTIRNIGGTTACWLYGHQRTVAPTVQPIDPIGDLFPSPQSRTPVGEATGGRKPLSHFAFLAQRKPVVRS